MFAWFHELSDPRVWILLVLAAVFILAWIAVEIRDRRDDRRADAELAAEQYAKSRAHMAAAERLPTALSIPDVVHVKQELGVKAVSSWAPKADAIIQSEREPVAPVADAIIRSIRKRASQPRPAPKRAKRPNKRKIKKPK